MKRPDVRINGDRSLKWDDFVRKTPTEALPAIYDHAVLSSHRSREWYWSSVKGKKHASVGVRFLSYSFAVLGVFGPLVSAAFMDPVNKLILTQAGVAAIAIAGVLQLSDSIFGWSSGWLRYTTTVTAMERLTLQFQLEWASYCVSKPAFGEEDKKLLFDLAKNFELEIEKRRSEETDGWVAEFNRGMAALNEMIKFQKDATEKAAIAAKSAIESKTQATRSGAIELTVTHANGAQPIKVFLDDSDMGSFTGQSWAVTGLVPGLHKLCLQTGGKSGDVAKIADVPAGGVFKFDVKVS